MAHMLVWARLFNKFLKRGELNLSFNGRNNGKRGIRTLGMIKNHTTD